MSKAFEMNRSIAFITGMVILTLLSCKREDPLEAALVNTGGQVAFLKIVHATPFFRQVTGAPDTFNIYIDGQKVNGAAFSYNSIFPAAGTNGYMAVQAGVKEIKLAIPGKLQADVDSVTILTLQKELAASKYYTLMITDSIKSARDSARIFVEDVYKTPAPGYVNIRFINTVIKDTGKVDLFSYAKGATIATRIKPDSVGGFLSVGFNAQTPDTFYITRTLPKDTAAPLAWRTVLAKLVFNSTNVVNLSAQRTVTLYYKGDTTVKARTLFGYVH